MVQSIYQTFNLQMRLKLLISSLGEMPQLFSVHVKESSKDE